MKSHILLVDDDVGNVQCIAALLGGKGHRVSVASNGREALQLLHRVRPDLILLDVDMPELDGFETCRRIKASTAWREVPVIFLTARTGIADTVRAFEVGAVDYMPKPFSAAELFARVDTHLSLDQLYKDNQRLLLNILPAPIAEKLKRQEGIIAERYDDVSVLFADIVDFTPLSAEVPPVELLGLLNRIFSGFDALAERHSLEKIKTIGDAYMVAGGLPVPRQHHLEAMAEMAMSMQEEIRSIASAGKPLTLRIGLHVGRVIAGVIGIRKFTYDVWGDTVNTASRLESHGMPGQIHVSDAVRLRLDGRYVFEPRGPTKLKGRGVVDTFFLKKRQ